ncbi:putative mitochondrial protein, partial [Mucuna pruriens]
MALLSNVEPKNVEEALLNDGWILTMQEELDQFQKNDVWKLVSPPNDKSIIGTNWIFRNKLDKNDKVVRNKARYLKGTANLDLYYKKFYQYKLKGYRYANFVGDIIERKGTSGGCHFIGVNLGELK